MRSGFLLIDKPTDWTSHDVVGYVRKIIREHDKKIGLPAEARRAKVGHAGTLDPFATGLLIVGVGREATKRLDTFKAMEKEYVATLQLGATSDTYDRTGTVQITDTGAKITDAQIQNILKTFIGKQKQVPPMYSAKKINGKKLYELARKGIEIERKPNEIEIYDLQTLSDTSALDRDSQIVLRISCSTGTYIRTLAHDIGQALGVGAYCKELRRTAIGPYQVTDAARPKTLSQDNWVERLFVF